MKAHTYPKKSLHQAPSPVSKEGHRHRRGHKGFVDAQAQARVREEQAKHAAVPPRWEVRGLADFSADELVELRVKLQRWVTTGIGREKT